MYAEDELNKIVKENTEDISVFFSGIARFHAILGYADKAISSLKEAITLGYNVGTEPD
jgi:hypothetical protein